MKKGTLYIFTGPSGTGKGTLLKRIMQQDEKLFLSVSATTRSPRVGECEGVHYFFLSHEEFEERVCKNAFLEHASYVGHRYGTLEAPVEEQLAKGNDVILEIEVQGAMQIHRKRPDAVMIFVAPPSFEELERRLCERGTEQTEVLALRLETAHREMDYQLYFDYIIVNDDLEQSARALASIFIAQRYRNLQKIDT